MRMCNIVTVACPAVQNFLFFCHKLHDFRKKKENFTEHKMCFDFLNKFCLKHFSF